MAGRSSPEGSFENSQQDSLREVVVVVIVIVGLAAVLSFTVASSRRSRRRRRRRRRRWLSFPRSVVIALVSRLCFVGRVLFQCRVSHTSHILPT
jgi:hypothetical protein